MNLVDKDHDVVWQCLEDFDFDRVKQVVDFLHWQWWDESGEYVLPNMQQLRNLARNQLLQAVHAAKTEGKYTLSSSGFEAHAEFVADELFVELKFVLTSWDNY